MLTSPTAAASRSVQLGEVNALIKRLHTDGTSDESPLRTRVRSIAQYVDDDAQQVLAAHANLTKLQQKLEVRYKGSRRYVLSNATHLRSAASDAVALLDALVAKQQPPSSPPAPISMWAATSRKESPAGWIRTAALWIAIRSPNFTFIHIPKTGGSSIERVDPTAPARRLPAGRLAAYTLRPTIAGDEEQCKRRRPFCRTDPNETRMPRCRGVGPTYHLPPSVITQCDLTGGRWGWYDGTGLNYCIVRDPIDRFVSSFLFLRSQSFWPHSCTKALANMHGQGSNESKITADDRRRTQLLCLASVMDGHHKAFASMQATFQDASNRWPFFQFTEQQVHSLPQSAFLSDAAGRPTCHVVFPLDYTRNASLPDTLNTGRTSESSKLKLLLRKDMQLRSVVERIFAPDVEMWARVSRGEAPTPKHTSISQWVTTMAQRWRNFMDAEPSCAPQSDNCSCSPGCCRAEWSSSRGDPSSISRRRCLECALTQCQAWT